MANRIKGLTVEIDGSTTGLDKALKNVNTPIKGTQTQLKDVQKLLKLDPSNTELLSQKQRLLKEAIGATKDKLDSVKTAQEQAKKQPEPMTRQSAPRLTTGPQLTERSKRTPPRMKWSRTGRPVRSQRRRPGTTADLSRRTAIFTPPCTKRQGPGRTSHTAMEERRKPRRDLYGCFSVKKHIGKPSKIIQV